MDQYIGEIRLFAGDYAPEDWAICDGRLLNINQYNVLYSLIGTTYGGNGTTTFAVPDLRGRAPVGIGQGVGLTARNLGSAFGTEAVTLTSAQMPTHTHPMTVSTGAATNIGPSNALLGNAGCTVSGTSYAVQYFDDGNPNTTTVTLNSQSVSNFGGNMPHNNRQPYVALTYIIALQGTYPQRP